MLPVPELRERYHTLQQRIVTAAERAERDPAAVTLIAVTKTWPAEVVVAAYEAGMRHFGENRPEELAQKRPLVAEAIGAADATWHLIGPVQSRKSALAAAHADVYHALEREKIARRLSADLAQSGRALPSFIEVNLSGEASKLGLNLTEWESDATQRANLRKVIKTTRGLPGLSIAGLMTMAPWDVDEPIIRDVFRRARALRDWLAGEMPELGALGLSMGMTDDFEIAVEEGATHVRVGRALFGERG